MALFQRGRVWWIDVKHKGIRHQESVGYYEKKARAREAEVKLLLRAGIPIRKAKEGDATCPVSKGGKSTVRTAFNVCWKVRWGGKPKTRPQSSVLGSREGPVLDRASIWTRSERICDLIGGITLDKLTVSDVADMLRELRETFELKDPTLRRYLSCLQTALTVANDDGLTDRVFSFKVLRNGLAESVGRKRVMTQDECERALDYILHRERYNRWCTRLEKTEILYAYFLTLFTLGGRVTETLMLKVDDLDLKAGTLTIRAETTKSRKGRTLPIGALAGVLGSLAAGRAPGERLFDITAQTVRRLWKGLRKHLGMTEDLEFVPHTIRHTAASHLANNVPLPVAQQILGHSAVTTTMLYVHPHEDNLREAQSSLEQFMSLKT